MTLDTNWVDDDRKAQVTDGYIEVGHPAGGGTFEGFDGDLTLIDEDCIFTGHGFRRVRNGRVKVPVILEYVSEQDVLELKLSGYFFRWTGVRRHESVKLRFSHPEKKALVLFRANKTGERYGNGFPVLRKGGYLRMQR